MRMRWWQRSICVSVALWGLASTGVIGDDLASLRNVLREKSGAVGQVIAIPGPGKQSLGTGFVMGAGDQLVTNAHVVQGAKSVSVFFPDGASLGCRLVDIRPDLDLALLQITDGAGGGATKRASVAEIDAGWKPQKLDGILLVSNPNDLNDTPTIGTFSGTRKARDVKTKLDEAIFASMDGNTDVYQFDVTATQGSSGGPIFATSGKVVAILAARHRESTERYVFGIPAGNINSLNKNKTPQAFGSENEWRLRPIREGNQLSYTTDSARSPIVKSSAGVTIDRSSRSLGFINPNFIGTYLDDPAKISQLVPPPLYGRLTQLNRLVNVINIPFRLSFVVPESFRITEAYDAKREMLTIELTEPSDRQTMTIQVRHIDTPPAQLESRLDSLASDFVRDTLRVQILGIPMGRPVPPTAGNTEVALGPFSDVAPRPRWLPSPAVKFWRHYMAAPQYDKAHLVMYGITTNSFVVVHVPYHPSRATVVGPPSQDIIERAFVAGTVSLLP